MCKHHKIHVCIGILVLMVFAFYLLLIDFIISILFTNCFFLNMLGFQINVNFSFKIIGLSVSIYQYF